MTKAKAPSFSRREAKDRPPVGVLSKTHSFASALAREMNVTNVVLLSPANAESAARGVDLGTLIVDEACWPLDQKTREALGPALHTHKAYVMVVNRHDPFPKAAQEHYASARRGQ